MKYADIIIPLALNQTYTYTIPQQLEKNLNIGQRVVVQFGKKRFYCGIVKSFHNDKPPYDTKEIHSVLESTPILNKKNLDFWEWISTYYMSNLGDVMSAAIPISLRLESETKITLTAKFSNYNANEDELPILSHLEKKGNESIAAFIRLNNTKNVLKIINNLLDKEIIDVYEKISENYKPKFEKYCKISSSIKSSEELSEIFKTIKRATKQTEMLLAYCSISKLYFVENSPFFKEVKRDELLEKSNFKVNIYTDLLKKGILEEYNKEKSRFNINLDEITNIKDLTEPQQKAFEEIKSNFETHSTTLLYGITSSGKTEIYIKLIEEQIQQGKQVLYLLPEIALTTQIIGRLRKAFGNKVGVYHSRFDDNQRAEVWRNMTGKIENQQPFKIILGVRSAIFLPFDNLGLIIVDEEHENTYKQHNPAPRYNARDCAVYLSKIFNAKVLLGTATPSVETYYNCITGKYGYVELLQRFKNIDLPEIEIVDTLKARKNKQMKSIFHQQLIDNIQTALNNKEQIILFQNKRGFAPYIQCEDCGEIVKCDNCDVSMTYHIDINKLVCHYCGSMRTIPNNCEYCGDTHLKTRSFGTQKVEDEIKIFFPQARVSRLDIDVSKRKNGYENVLEDFNNHKTDILIGTQMVTKGLDFENVSLVGVLDADHLLNFPDFRSNERTFQLITQVSGRAGRGKKRGKVIVQTYSSNNKVLEQIKLNDFEVFFKKELEERQEYSYPPFTRLLKIIMVHKEQKIVKDFAKNTFQNLSVKINQMVSAPYEPNVAKIKNLHHQEILIKIPPKTDLLKIKNFVKYVIETQKRESHFSGIRVAFNVDA